jgi:serine phosphatase RsbU (regulator of sigma subunit)
MNDQEELLGEDRLAGICADFCNVPIATLVENAFREIDQFMADAPQRDDQAMLVLEVAPCRSGES